MFRGPDGVPRRSQRAAPPPLRPLGSGSSAGSLPRLVHCLEGRRRHGVAVFAFLVVEDQVVTPLVVSDAFLRLDCPILVGCFSPNWGNLSVEGRSFGVVGAGER